MDEQQGLSTSCDSRVINVAYSTTTEYRSDSDGPVPDTGSSDGARIDASPSTRPSDESVIRPTPRTIGITRVSLHSNVTSTHCDVTKVTTPSSPLNEQRKLARLRPEQPANPRCLKVAVIGAPNAGKSTLANKLMGWRFSSVSDKVHTTRVNTLGILTEGNTQVIFLDTPGMTTPSKVKKHRLNRALLTDPHTSLFDADLIAVVTDVSTVWGSNRLDPEVLKALYLHKDKEAVLIMNKVDRVKHKQNLLKFTRILTENRVGGRADSYTVKQEEQSKTLDHIFDDMSETEGEVNNLGLRADQMNRYDTMEYASLEEEAQRYSASSHIRESTEVNAAESQQVPSARDKNHSTNDSYINGPSDIQKYSELDLEEVKSSPSRGNGGKNLAWTEYYRKLNKAHNYTLDHKGWPHFSRVFMISALDGDGVWDIKSHLLDQAQPGPWLYHSALVTDQDPIELARLCVWEKVMDHLSKELPYQIHVRVVVWEVDDQGMLHSVFDLVCDRNRQLYAALGKGGQTIRKIAAEAKQELMNTFQTELTLKIAISTKN